MKMVRPEVRGITGPAGMQPLPQSQGREQAAQKIVTKADEVEMVGGVVAGSR